MILNYLSKFLSSFIMMSATIYVWNKLLNKKEHFNNTKTIIVTLMLSIVSIANYYIVNQYIKVLSITIFLMICFKILTNESLQKCIITPIISQLITLISEVIFAIIVILIYNFDSKSLMEFEGSAFLTNIVITCLTIIIVQIPHIRYFYNYLIKITEKLDKKIMVIIFLTVIFIANMLLGIMYYKVDFKYAIIVNFILTIFYFSTVIYSLKTTNNYIKVYDKYSTTLNNLREYENILDKYRLFNHENKNQLLTIRNMLPMTNKKVISYIDQVLKNRTKDDETVMKEVSKIPVGGLRGLIYSKIILMKESGISYKLNISKDVKISNFINLDDSIVLNICKIIGVYLDNSIEAVINLDNKYVEINMYIEREYLNISISNNYEGIIEINKLENKGYTTKSDGHGYGLSLAKEIIDSNKKLSNEKRLSSDIFSQILKVKL